MSALQEFNQAFGFRFHEPLRADQVAVLVNHARTHGQPELAERLQAEANGGNEGASRTGDHEGRADGVESVDRERQPTSLPPLPSVKPLTAAEHNAYPKGRW